MWNYGNDKPDIRFKIKVANLKVEGKNYFEGLNNTAFAVFNNAETIVAIPYRAAANIQENKRMT